MAVKQLDKARFFEGLAIVLDSFPWDETDDPEHWEEAFDALMKLSKDPGTGRIFVDDFFHGLGTLVNSFHWEGHSHHAPRGGWVTTYKKLQKEEERCKYDD